MISFWALSRSDILYHAQQEPVYGLALIQELRRHGYELSPGTLYPILHRLEAQGYLVAEERVVSGRVANTTPVQVQAAKYWLRSGTRCVS